MNKQKKVAFLTLGCKVNQFEADSVAKQLEENGFIVENEITSDCDFVILSTCAVTNEAERKSRQMLSKINKLAPNARIIVCGCASQHQAKNFEGKKNVSVIIGTSSKHLLPLILEESGAFVVEPPLDWEEMSAPLKHRTRAYVKVQDGCNNFCSYCLIPYVRGRSRSRPLESIIVECFNIAKHSKEIVLTGINISAWGQDINRDMIDLLSSLTTINARIRISSMEMNIITPQLIETIKKMPNFCHHFHLSMQSGCDKVLKDMNRHYTSAEFLEKVKMLKDAFPDCNITTDLIVGFPGETDEDFKQTIDTIKRAKFGYIHIFPYSRRAGTVASRKPNVDANIVKERVMKVTKLRDELEKEFLEKQLGTVQEMLCEQEKDEYIVGHTRNFTKVYLPKKQAEPNDLAYVRIDELYLDGVKGSLVEIVKDD